MPFDPKSLCCSEEQVVLLVDYLLYMVTCLLLWHSRSLLPLKLFSVFLHELSHAMAVWLTCNKVTGIEVNANRGGLTHWTAKANHATCARLAVLPAGYLGSAAWGGAILVCCVEPLATRVMACVLIVALLIALGYSFFGANSNKKDWTLAALCSGMILVLVALLCICYFTDWQYKDLLLSRVLLLVGVMSTLFATYDIWESCVSRTVEDSDAYKFAELIRCATPKCVGAIWLFLSVVMAIGLLILALLWTGGGQAVRGLNDFSMFSWVCMLLPAGVCAAAIAFRMLCSSTYQGRLAPRVTRGLPKLPSLEAELDGRSSEESAGSPKEVCLTTGTHALGAVNSEDFVCTSRTESSDDDFSEESSPG
ncbi:unnamed protein product [Polarella glacialis]|uniref:Uncharacterized protein n=1 Tax=Polarella glacialis TaxID=89957 RepID=A0A813FC46_POLGL|nr:unnamed protein product [Polarella glacialis]CAE8686212.1 unnamed protein product [Polarella glacialis]